MSEKSPSAIDPKLLEISHNMLDAMHRWADYNGFSSW